MCRPLWVGRMATDSLTDSLRETLTVFDTPGTPQTTTEVADTLSIGRRSAYERLRRLVDRGRLETKKVGASGRVWWQPLTSTGSGGSGGGRDWSAPAEPTEGNRQPEQYGMLFEQSRDVNVVVDTGGRFQTITGAVRSVLGYEAEDLIGEVGSITSTRRTERRR